jgi:hypothetical protein
VIVGQAPNLQNQLISLYHDSAVGGIQELQWLQKDWGKCSIGKKSRS